METPLSADYVVPDEDVDRGWEALDVAHKSAYHLQPGGCCIHVSTYTRAVLAAVLPAHDARLRLRWEEDEAAGGLPLVEHDRQLILYLADEAQAAGEMWAAHWLADVADQIGGRVVVDVSHDMKIDDPLLGDNG